MYYDIKKSVIIFISEKFSEMITGNEKGQFLLFYCHKIMMVVRVHF